MRKNEEVRPSTSTSSNSNLTDSPESAKRVKKCIVLHGRDSDASEYTAESYIRSLLEPCTEHPSDIFTSNCRRCSEREQLLRSSADIFEQRQSKISGLSGRGGDSSSSEPVSLDSNVEIVEDSSGFNYPSIPKKTGMFILEMVHSRSFKRRDVASEMTYAVKVRNPKDNVLLRDILPQLHAMFESLLSHLMTDYHPHDVARVYIQHPELASPIIVPPMYLGYLTAYTIMNQIEYVLHSAEAIPADNLLTINVAVVKGIRGSARLQIINAENDGFRKKSTITINNGDSDKLCLPRAIVVAKAHLDWKKQPNCPIRKKYYNSVRDGRRKKQFTEAVKLLSDSGLPSDLMREGSIHDIPSYENVLRISICVISADVNAKRFEKIYNGNPHHADRIFLYHFKNGHFDVITKMNALMCKTFYCDNCHKGFDRANQHSCKSWCSVCCSFNCEEDQSFTCNDCNHSCRSIECYNRHKEKTVSHTRTNRLGNKHTTEISLCKKNWKCLICSVKINTLQRNPNNHICGEMFCINCRYFCLAEDHLCYMRSIAPSGKTPSHFIFYDFECQQDREDGGLHFPNLVVTHSVCNLCKDENVTDQAICESCGSRCLSCEREKDKPVKPLCPGKCGFREKIFKGKDAANKFCEWLISRQHKGFTVIAHNAKAYDNYFIFRFCIEKNIIPKVIFSGSKIMYMLIGLGLNIRCLDSVNFLPMPLSDLPKSFGLEELKKGYFPHYFNTSENQGVVFSHLPDKSFYDPDTMHPKKRKAFLAWYEKNREKEFDFDKELLEYCRSDVDILLKACMKYKTLVEEITAKLTEKDGNFPVNPFSCLTTASVCLAVFRAKFLTETWEILLKHNANEDCIHEKVQNCSCEWTKARKRHGSARLEYFCPYRKKWLLVDESSAIKRRFVSSPIGLIPPGGYQRRDQQSLQACKWLKFMENKLQQKYNDSSLDMRYAGHPQGEKRVRCLLSNGSSITYKLDGEVILKCGKKIALEFNGCHWHGCKHCYANNREDLIICRKSIALRYRETRIRERRLKQEGYDVITKWACEFEEDLKNYDEMKRFVSSLEISIPIDVRDCYFGGRTNAIQLYKKFNSLLEKGRYVDFCSLYPAAMKYNHYPVGHPEKIVADFKQLFLKKCENTEKCGYNIEGHTHHIALPYFGIMKVMILPPKRLLFPVLPYKALNKLKFPLCRTCAEKVQPPKECQCNDKDRAITHTYCTPELEVAINMGYKILKIYEVLHWRNSKEETNAENGIFSEYINTFLRIKQEASGLPLNRDVDSYIEEYFKHEGIRLKKENIAVNPGLRKIAKLKLNTLYGKFGQNTDRKKTLFVNTVEKLYETLISPAKEVTDFHILSPDLMQIEYKHNKYYASEDIRTNVILAAFCTSWARLKLWFLLNRLGTRVLYHDTDSVIFTSPATATSIQTYEPEIGDYLGDLTDELSCSALNCRGCIEGHWIEEFVACGPKNYAYKLNSGEHVCKVRGFSLNHSASLVLNFESMKTSLIEWHKNLFSKADSENEKTSEKEDLFTVSTMIMRNKHSGVIYNKIVTKRYGIMYDKRVLKPDFSTVPLGYT